MVAAEVPKDKVNFGPEVPFHSEERAFEGRVEAWLCQKRETLSSLQPTVFIFSETRLLCGAWSQGLRMNLHQIRI